jgi:hypothetical protein
VKSLQAEHRGGNGPKMAEVPQKMKNCWMLNWKTTAVCDDNHTEHKNTTRGKCCHFSVKAGGIYCNHKALNGL